MLSCPLGTSPRGSVDGQRRHSRQSQLPLNRRPNHEWPDTHCELRELDSGGCGGDAIVDSGSQAHPPTDGSPLDPSDDQFGTSAYRQDDQREPLKEILSRFAAFDGNQFIKARSCTKSLFALGLEYQHAHFRMAGGVVDGMGQPPQDFSGKGIALGMKETDGGNSIGDLSPDEGSTFRRLWFHFLAPLCDGNKRTGRCTRVDLSRTTDGLAVFRHLFPLGNPTG